jgi:hypothetical protein
MTLLLPKTSVRQQRSPFSAPFYTAIIVALTVDVFASRPLQFD